MPGGRGEPASLLVYLEFCADLPQHALWEFKLKEQESIVAPPVTATARANDLLKNDSVSTNARYRRRTGFCGPQHAACSDSRTRV